MKVIYLVIPCYNEEQIIKKTGSQLSISIRTLISENKISPASKILFVDDGSTDKTWSLLVDMCKAADIYCAVKLSKNRGHQNALLAGLMSAKHYCDAAISLDADLQDDIEAIPYFVEKFINGADVVYGIRNSRKSDTFLKRITAQVFYKLQKSLGADIIYDHADYRLLSKRLLFELEKYKEVNLYLRGIIPMCGFKSDSVYYERKTRGAGYSKYSIKKMISFAIDGITSLTIKPIHLISLAGMAIFTISILLLLFFLYLYFSGVAIEGWSTIVVSLWGLGGMQLLAIGVIGEYIGKIYMESKHRPRYIVEKEINIDKY